jgi:hypothetical protein
MLTGPYASILIDVARKTMAATSNQVWSAAALSGVARSRARPPVLRILKFLVFRDDSPKSPGTSQLNPLLLSMNAMQPDACHVERSASISRPLRESQARSRNIPRCLQSKCRFREFWPGNCHRHPSCLETLNPKQDRKNSLQLRLLAKHSRDSFDCAQDKLFDFALKTV